MKLWWKCPDCKEEVDFTKEMSFVFDENGQSEFDPKHGLIFHTVECECGNNWTVSISEPEKLK